MIIETADVERIPLQVLAQNIDGTPKTSLTSAIVRVYHVTGTGEVEDLTATSMSQIGSTNTWRYLWEPTSLAVGHYFVEYTLSDPDGATCVAAEDLDIRDIAKQVDVDFIKRIESGRWKIEDEVMTFYDEDGNTPLLQFNLKDLQGHPSNINIFERDPV